jgi:hypothetical protein
MVCTIKATNREDKVALYDYSLAHILYMQLLKLTYPFFYL